MVKKKIAVLIEEHFDPTEYRKFNSYFPAQGYDVEYVTYLWGQKSLTFGSNPDNGVVEEHVTVSIDVTDLNPASYAGVILIGGYAMDRLRYQAKIVRGEPNCAPAVVFLRRALAVPTLTIGTICHSLWLFCADTTLLRGRSVTCAHNVICDVENAGGIIVYEGDETADIVVDGTLVSAKHPGIVDAFMERFVKEMRSAS